MEEIEILPRSAHYHYVRVTDPPKLIQWWFSTKKNSLGFGLYYKNSPSAQPSTQILLPSDYSSQRDTVPVIEANHHLSSSSLKHTSTQNTSASSKTTSSQKKQFESSGRLSTILDNSTTPEVQSKKAQKKIEQKSVNFKEWELLIPEKTYQSSKSTIKGQHFADAPGIYLLYFSNTFSLTKSKILTLLVSIKNENLDLTSLSPPIHMSGWLFKKKRRRMQGWAKRWVWIQGSMLLYSTTEGGIIRGKVSIPDSVVSVEPSKMLLIIDNDKVFMQFEAAEQNSFDLWVSKLREIKENPKYSSSDGDTVNINSIKPKIPFTDAISSHTDFWKNLVLAKSLFSDISNKNISKPPGIVSLPQISEENDLLSINATENSLIEEPNSDSSPKPESLGLTKLTSSSNRKISVRSLFSRQKSKADGSVATSSTDVSTINPVSETLESKIELIEQLLEKLGENEKNIFASLEKFLEKENSPDSQLDSEHEQLKEIKSFQRPRHNNGSYDSLLDVFYDTNEVLEVDFGSKTSINKKNSNDNKIPSKYPLGNNAPTCTESPDIEDNGEEFDMDPKKTNTFAETKNDNTETNNENYGEGNYDTDESDSEYFDDVYNTNKQFEFEYKMENMHKGTDPSEIPMLVRDINADPDLRRAIEKSHTQISNNMLSRSSSMVYDSVVTVPEIVNNLESVLIGLDTTITYGKSEVLDLEIDQTVSISEQLTYDEDNDPPSIVTLAVASRAGVAPKRAELPAPEPESSINLISIMRKYIGKDLSQVQMPIEMNEPISATQALCEELECSWLLDKAAFMPDSMDRIMYVTAFAISAYAPRKYRTSYKPFNPMLGETYEFVRPDLGFRFISEKVSHHPMVVACHADSPNYSFWQDSNIKTRFWGRSLELSQTSLVHIDLPATGDHYTYSKGSTLIKGILSGNRTIEFSGTITVTNHTTGDVATITFKESTMFSDSNDIVDGIIVSGQNKKLKRKLVGKWSNELFWESENGPVLLWKAKEYENGVPPNQYGFGNFAVQLNEITNDHRIDPKDNDGGYVKNIKTIKVNSNMCDNFSESIDIDFGLYKLPPTDSRLRPDMQSGVEYKPKWFELQPDPSDPKIKTYKYKGGYWKSSLKNAFAKDSCFAP
ncbi:hypothetical protein BB558_003118 [Smittium angustum]|uniref:PH domain-containing protein n=1 Tax=Smittium angustum TaxID=133377 RepID=A0A2U1J756_SMIAN|nr:hypothetical protein BB558_003118 [Smittium angustum]